METKVEKYKVEKYVELGEDLLSWERTIARTREWLNEIDVKVVDAKFGEIYQVGGMYYTKETLNKGQLDAIECIPMISKIEQRLACLRQARENLGGEIAQGLPRGEWIQVGEYDVRSTGFLAGLRIQVKRRTG